MKCPLRTRWQNEALNDAALRPEAAEVLRGLLKEIRLVPERCKLEIEVAGDTAGILALGPNDKRPPGVPGGVRKHR